MLSLTTDLNLLSCLIVLRRCGDWLHRHHFANIRNFRFGLLYEVLLRCLCDILGAVYQPKKNCGRTATKCWRICERWFSMSSRVNRLHKTALEKLQFIGNGSVIEQRLVQVGHDNVWGMVRPGLYCWHWYAGRTGTNRDVNILSISPFLRDILTGHSNSERIRDTGQLRTEKKAVFVISHSRWDITQLAHIFKANEQCRCFGTKQIYSQGQETTWKDVEHKCGVLQSRLEIMRREMRYWDLEAIICISKTCFMLQNLIFSMQQTGAFCDE